MTSANYQITSGTFADAGGLATSSEHIVTGLLVHPTAGNTSSTGYVVNAGFFNMLQFVNTTPVITEGATTSVSMSMNGLPTPFSLTLHASDADNDTLTWSITAPAGHGTATASGTGASMAVAYTPTTGYAGPDSFTVQVTDGKGGTASITVSVTVIQTYTVTFASSGNGTLTGTTTQTVNHGSSTTTVTAVPNMGYQFANWTEGGAQASTSTALTVTNVTADHSFTANFTKIGTANVSVGSHPYALAINPITNKTYVVNYSTNNITVIDGATNSATTLTAGTGPYAVAINSITNKIYVANYTSNTVTVIDGATNVTATVAVGPNPQAVAVNPVTNRIYVANQNSVTVINGSDNSTTTVASGSVSAAIAVNPVTNQVYVANRNSNNVTVIDGATNVATTVATGNGPTAVAINPVTNKVYVANYGSNNVTIIDGRDNSTVNIAAGIYPQAVAVNPVTNMVYVANYTTSNVTVIDGATHATTTVAVGTYPRAIAVNSITNKVYVANSNSYNVTIINGNDNNSTTDVPTGALVFAIAVNPVTDKAYVVNNNSNNVTVIDGRVNSTTTVTTGAAPSVIATNQVTDRIYVANSNSNNVTVINGSTNETTTVAVGTNPRAIAVNPITNKAYVANAGNANVTIINGSDNSTVSVPAGAGPAAIAINPVTNRIYVANTYSNNVTVIDGATNSTATVATGANLRAIAVNPATNKIYVANASSDTVTVIDGRDNSTATVVTGASPWAIAVNPITNKIYVANSGANTVTVIDGATNATTTVTTGSGPWVITVNPITNKVYAANSSNSVTVIDGATNSTATVTVGSGPRSFAVDSLANKIFVANSTSNSVTIIDGATNTTTTVATDSGSYDLAFNPITGKVYATNYTVDKVTVLTEQRTMPNPLTTAITPLANNKTHAPTPSFTLTPTNGFVPSTGALTVYYQLDTWQGPWQKAQPTPPLTPGVHTLYAFAADAQAATSVNTGLQSSPLVGTMAAYTFLVVPNTPPVITEGASTTVSMSMNGTPTAFSLTLHASDADGDTLTWSISSAAGNGTATASGTGASKVISYTPTTGYAGPDSFTVQVDDGNGGTASITVNVTIIQTYLVTFTTDGNGALTGTTSQTVDTGTSTTLVSAVPNTGYHFVNWTGTGEFVTTTANPLTVSNVTAAMNITANFAINTYALTVSRLGIGAGTVTSDTGGIDCGSTCSSIYNYGTSVTLSASPAPSSTFAGWSGVCAGVGSSCQVTMNSSKNVSVTFLLKSYLVTFTTDGNGTLTGTTSQTVNHGSSATEVTAVPNTGYRFVNWTGTGGFVTTTANPLTVSNVTADQTVTANFALDPVNGTCGVANGGTFTVAPTTDLCTAGTPTALSGSGPWTWSCTGLYGGTTADCSANIQSVTSGISGSVTEADGATPLAGATIEALQTADVVVASTVSAADGTYTLPLPTGAYKIIVRTGNHITAIYPLVIVSAAETVNMSLLAGQMLAFDEFTSASLDSDIWDTHLTGPGSIGNAVSAMGQPTAFNFVGLHSGYGGAGSAAITSKSSVASFDTPVVFESRVSAYAENWYPGIYGDGQPRGLRVGTDPNNAIEFISSSLYTVTARTVASGVATTTLYTLPAGTIPERVSEWDLIYRIEAGTAEAKFYVNNVLVATHTTNIPAGPLNAYLGTIYDGYGNVPVSTDYILLGTKSIPPAPVNGVCGAANGGTFTVAPTENLCTAGTQTAVTGSGPWNWSCTGLFGGTTAGCSASIQTYLLTLSMSGTGSGTVTSVPAGIECGATCSAPFSHGTPVVLFQTPGNSSGFSGWGDACSGTGDCTFSMSSNKAVTASFTSSPLVKNQRTGVAYSLLQTAYADALDGDTIMALATLPTAGLNLDAAKSLTIEGGYASDYTACPGLTTVSGPVTVKAPMRMSGLAVRAEQSSARAITAFSFATPAATGVIDEGTRTIAVTVPSGTDVTALVPTITHTGAEISPVSGAPQDFTNPVVYTITAENLSTQDYTVTVTVAPWTSCGDILTYAGENYPTVQIGSQCWFARNMNAGSMVSIAEGQGTSCSTIQKFCYNDTASSCSTYGGLYTWTQAMCGAQIEGSQGICPSGWHIPSDPEYVALTNYLGPGDCSTYRSSDSNYCGAPAGDRLKATGLCQGRTPCGDSGFNGLLGGSSYGTDYYGMGEHTIFWTSSINGFEAWRSGLSLEQGGVDSTYWWSDFPRGRTIRCLKD